MVVKNGENTILVVLRNVQTKRMYSLKKLRNREILGARLILLSENKTDKHLQKT